jgi:hypothetical protein
MAAVTADVKRVSRYLDPALVIVVASNAADVANLSEDGSVEVVPFASIE